MTLSGMSPHVVSIRSRRAWTVKMELRVCAWPHQRRPCHPGGVKITAPRAEATRGGADAAPIRSARPDGDRRGVGSCFRALSGYLSADGEDVSTLGAEVMMPKSVVPLMHNHFSVGGFGLHPDVTAFGQRAGLIAAKLADRRRRADAQPK